MEILDIKYDFFPLSMIIFDGHEIKYSNENNTNQNQKGTLMTNGAQDTYKYSTRRGRGSSIKRRVKSKG